MAAKKWKEPTKSGWEPVKLEWDDFTLELAGRDPERVDKRASKTYGREGGISGTVSWEGDDWVFRGLGDYLLRVFRPVRVKVDAGCAGNTKDSEVRRAYITVRLPTVQADKPSLILSEKEAWASLGLTFASAARKVQLAVTRAHKAWNDENELEERARQANAIRPWASKLICEKAREDTGFTARLAALRRELTERTEELIAARGEKMAADLAASDWREAGERFHPRAIEVGLAKGLEDAVSSCSSAGGSSFFGRGNSNTIQPKDVA